MTKKPQKLVAKSNSIKKTVKKVQKTTTAEKVALKKIIVKKTPAKKSLTRKDQDTPSTELNRSWFQIVGKPVLLSSILILTVVLTTAFYLKIANTSLKALFIPVVQQENEGGPREELYPLTIEYMRKQEYPGSSVTIEQELPAGSNYNRYIASYKSDGLKIYALLTVPQGDKPEKGWPVIIFNHGYIPPAEYRTNERYIEYTDAFSRNGYVVFRSDYRGHGNSEGNPEGGYYSPAYTIDVLNAVSSVKKIKDPSNESSGEPIVDPERIGMWGHSMGGHLTLRTMVTTHDIKAGVIWAGVVADYNDLDKNWTRAYPFVPSEKELAFRRMTKQSLIEKFGTVDQNPAFWQSIAPISYVGDISGPLQIHHGTSDGEVPLLFSERLETAMIKSKKNSELFIYPDDDHNISHNLYTALERSVAFFDKYLK